MDKVNSQGWSSQLYESVSGLRLSGSGEGEAGESILSMGVLIKADVQTYRHQLSAKIANRPFT